MKKKNKKRKVNIGKEMQINSRKKKKKKITNSPS